MNRTKSVFALAVAAALAFGATQAVAAPGASQERACNKIFLGWCADGAATSCAIYCASLGFTSSTCTDDPMRPRSCCTCG